MEKIGPARRLPLRMAGFYWTWLNSRARNQSPTIEISRLARYCLGQILLVEQYNKFADNAQSVQTDTDVEVVFNGWDNRGTTSVRKRIVASG